MRKGIHPEYHEVEVHCACGTTWKSRSTKKEVRLELLESDNERWQQLRAEMRSTQKLYERVRKLGLGLTMPQPEQVLRLSDLPLDAKEQKQSEPGEYRTVKNTPRRGRP